MFPPWRGITTIKTRSIYMATRQEFCDAMEEVYRNHGVYIGTANGEYTESLTVGQIHKMEQTYARRDSKGTSLWNSDTRRDLAYIGKCYEQGFDMSKSRAGIVAES